MDIDVGSNFFNITLSDMVNIIYKQITFGIGILFEYEINTKIKDIYKGPSTLLNILIEYQKLCIDSINLHNELIEYYNNKKHELEKSEIIQKKQRSHYYKIYRFFPTKKTKNTLDKIDNKIGNLHWEDNYYLDKLFNARITKWNTFKKYLNLYSYLDSIIDFVGENSLKEGITKLNILMPKNDDNYFDENRAIKIALKKWFINENKKIIESIEDKTIASQENSEEQKNLIKK